jgi:hypothetical protein
MNQRRAARVSTPIECRNEVNQLEVAELEIVANIAQLLTALSELRKLTHCTRMDKRRN